MDVDALGQEILKRLDSAVYHHRSQGHVITGIVISTPLKNLLKNACCKVYKADPKELDIRKFMGIPIIETSERDDRCEVIWKRG